MSELATHQARLQVTGELGEGLDKQLDQAEADSNRLFGAAAGLAEGAKKLANLAEHIRKDFDEGKLDKLDGKGVHDLLLSYNRRASEQLANLAGQKKSEALVAQGRVSAFKESVALAQRYHNSALARCQQLQAPVEEPEPEAAAKGRRRGRRAGEHPGPSPLDERRAAAKTAAKTAKKKATRKRGVRKKET